MQRYKELVLVLLILCCCIGCDQVTKDIARNLLRGAEAISYCRGVFRLQYAENTGGFLSLGSRLSESLRFWLLIVFPGVLLLAFLLVIAVLHHTHLRVMMAVAILAGGGISNLVDRLFNDGRVIDFMNIGIGTLRTGVFNVADLAIMTGTGLLLLWSISVKSD